MHARVQVDDSEAFARSVRTRYDPDMPCIAAGQSMGGLVSAQLVLRDQSAWAGLVLCSALIDADWTLILRSVRCALQKCPPHKPFVLGIVYPTARFLHAAPGWLPAPPLAALGSCKDISMLRLTGYRRLLAGYWQVCCRAPR